MYIWSNEYDALTEFFSTWTVLDVSVERRDNITVGHEVRIHTDRCLHNDSNRSGIKTRNSQNSRSPSLHLWNKTPIRETFQANRYSSTAIKRTLQPRGRIVKYIVLCKISTGYLYSIGCVQKVLIMWLARFMWELRTEDSKPEFRYTYK